MSIPVNLHSEFLFIKAAFQSGSIKRMRDLEKQKPTRIAKLTGINQGRYVAKLYQPENFTPSEIIRIGLVIDLDPGFIINVIKKELIVKEEARILKNFQALVSSKENDSKK